jgi:hypothetical protein
MSLPFTTPCELLHAVRSGINPVDRQVAIRTAIGITTTLTAGAEGAIGTVTPFRILGLQTAGLIRNCGVVNFDVVPPQEPGRLLQAARAASRVISI